MYPSYGPGQCYWFTSTLVISRMSYILKFVGDQYDNDKLPKPIEDKIRQGTSMSKDVTLDE